ncbi:EpsG family protein [Mucilaginibacter sp. HD30]
MPKIRWLLVYVGGTLCFLILWLLATIRWETGTDWNSYYDTFTYFSEIYRQLFEPGFGYLVSFIRSLTDNYTVYLLIFSFLCLSLKFIYINKYHKDTLFTVLLLFLCYYFADIFAVRQNLSISLTLISTIFIIKRKPILFIVVVALATSIHFTSALYFSAYYIYWRPIKDRTFYILIIIAVILGLVGVGTILLNGLLQIVGVTGHVGEKITGYLSGDNDTLNTNNNPLVIYLLGTLKRFIFIPIFVWVKNEANNNNNTNLNGYFNLYMVGNFVYFLFAKDLAVFARASVPFLFFEIFLVAYTMSYFKSSKIKLAIVFVAMSFVALSRFNALINSYYDLYVPYYSIFDKNIKRDLE